MTSKLHAIDLTKHDSMATAYENSAWAQVKEGWRQLYGSFSREGISVENHEFHAAASVNWGRSFHRNSVELCLNLRGTGTVSDKKTEARYQPHTVGFYCNANADLEARRTAGETHSFITVELSREYLETQVHSMEDDLHPALRRWLINKGGSAAAVGAMSPGRKSLFNPCVSRRFPKPPGSFGTRPRRWNFSPKFFSSRSRRKNSSASARNESHASGSSGPPPSCAVIC